MSRDDCQHETGWYITARFFVFFKKRIFVCSRCGEAITQEPAS